MELLCLNSNLTEPITIVMYIILFRMLFFVVLSLISILCAVCFVGVTFVICSRYRCHFTWWKTHQVFLVIQNRMGTQYILLRRNWSIIWKNLYPTSNSTSNSQWKATNVFRFISFFFLFLLLLSLFVLLGNLCTWINMNTYYAHYVYKDTFISWFSNDYCYAV